MTRVSVTGGSLTGYVRHAEDLLKVLEQQAHSAVSQESSAPSTSGQGAAKAPGSQAEPPAKRPQPPSSQQVVLAMSKKSCLYEGTSFAFLSSRLYVCLYACGAVCLSVGLYLCIPV